jgi:hypothetical protein
MTANMVDSPFACHVEPDQSPSSSQPILRRGHPPFCRYNGLSHGHKVPLGENTCGTPELAMTRLLRDTTIIVKLQLID